MTSSSDSFRNVTKYTGQDYRFAPSYIRPRAPTSADIKPKEQQGYYPITSLWTYPTSQSIWALASITNNLANWILISSGSSGPTLGFPVPNGTSPVVPSALGQVTLTSSGGTIAITGSTNAINFDLSGGTTAVDSFAVQAITAPGVSPVLPTAGGLVTFNGSAVAAHSVPIETRSRALNAMNVEVQYSSAVAATDATKNGVSHYNSAEFTVDASGFVSLSSGGIDLRTARYIVSAGGGADGANYTTIATAYAAAVAAGGAQTVFLQPGTYTENISLSPNVDITAFSGDGDTPTVTIIGKLTLTTAGSVSISNIRLQTNSDFFLAVTGSADSIVNLENCYLNCTNNTGISYTTSGTHCGIRILNCLGDIGTTGIALFASSGGGAIPGNAYAIVIQRCYITNTGGSSTANTASSGNITVEKSTFLNPFSTSSTGTISFEYSDIGTQNENATCVTSAGTGSIGGLFSTFASGSGSAISIGAGTTGLFYDCVISSTNINTITGAGSVTYSNIVYSNTSSGMNTTTQLVKPVGPRIQLTGGCQMISGSGSPNGSVTAPKGSLWLRTDGSGVNDRAYINTDAGTTWTAIVTVA